MAETYYSLTEIVKLCDNLVAAMPTSFYSGIMTVRTGLANLPAADVVARDCYDKILAENDDMRAIIDTYGGLENIQSAFVKLHEIETADVVPVRHGRWRWELADNGWANHICSNCGYTKNTDIHVAMDYRYCPNCGALMDKDGDGE